MAQGQVVTAITDNKGDTNHHAAGMRDAYGRRIHYLRVSLTDACNLRCIYCMPEFIQFRPRQQLLQDDEILFILRAAAAEGVDKMRLTGGEPTMRAGLVDLVRQIVQIPGMREVSMTTNGVLLSRLAQPLADAGLRRVNISLDTLDETKFRRITRWGTLGDVWAGIAAAEAVGLRPIKINCVVTRGYNHEDVVDLARLTLDRDWDIRFIELMPLGSLSGFQESAVVPWRETMGRIAAVLGPLHESPDHNGHDPARPFRLVHGKGTLGFVSSVTAPFCAGCNRIRLTADGRLRLCLLRDGEVDLLTPLRGGASVDTIRALIRDGVAHKPWGHGLAEHQTSATRVMSQIGG